MFIAEIIKQLKIKKSWSGEVSNCKKDGTPFITYAHVSALEIAGKQYLISVQENITERKKLEEELKEKIESLETFKKLTVDRELRMVEMKKEVDKLLKKLGQKPRYYS